MFCGESTCVNKFPQARVTALSMSSLLMNQQSAYRMSSNIKQGY